MPLITRVPITRRPASELPDPTQRLIRLRTITRLRSALLTAGIAGGTAAGTAIAAALGSIEPGAGDLVVAIALNAYWLWSEIAAQRRHCDAADELQPPVEVMRPSWRRTITGPYRRPLAVLFAGATGLSAGIGWLSGSALAPAYAAGFALGFVVHDLLLGRRQHREGRVYLERVDLPDDDLLYADPETVAVLERA